MDERENSISSTSQAGPLTILIPGTRWEGSGGWGPDNPLYQYGNGALGQSSGIYSTRLLRWSGRNEDRDRLEAATLLRQMIAEHTFGPDDELNILAHSHGGNVALAACHLGVAHCIDNLITLNKPTLTGEIYRAGMSIGAFFNISARGDWMQWAGSNAKFSGKWATDLFALNLTVDTSASDLNPHGALIWDDGIRERWWEWLVEQLAIR